MLDRFKSASLDMLRAAEPTDNLWLVTADGAVAGGSAAIVRDAIAALTPSSADSDLPAATRRAVGLARAASQSARTLAVFTDAQRASWPSGVSADKTRAIVFAPTVTLPENHSISFAEARPARWSPRGEVALRISARDSLTFRVTLAGRTLARGTAAPGVETIVRAAPPERGWLGGSVDVAPDELAADDIRYFATMVGAAPSVAATPGAGEFVTTALETLRGSSRIVPGNAIAIGPADEIASLPAVILAPSDPVRLGAANRALERLGVPWRFGTRRAQTADATLAGTGRVGVMERYELNAQSGAIADTVGMVGREPWVVAGTRYVIVASPLSAAATSLPVQAGFVPWLAETIADRVTGESGTVIAAAPGTWVRGPAGVDQLERPDGATVAVSDSLRVPPNAGVYFFLTNGRRTGAIVVNPPARESRLDRMSVSEIRSLIPGATVISDADSPQLSSAAFTAASTRSLLPPILIATLIALLGEALLVSARRREA